MSSQPPIRTPDHRLRVFVSSTLEELAPERTAARAAISKLRLAPILFELGARPHPPRDLYKAYLEQSHVFIGVYWERYGWVAPGMDISGLEDEYMLSAGKPKLIYVKDPAPDRQPRLKQLLDRIRSDESVSYKKFKSASELRRLIEDDVALLLAERFEGVDGASGVEGAEPLPAPARWPVPASPIIGRFSELEAVTELLLRDDVRLVTLTGAGGIGKSRLALELVERLRDKFEDGVSFVALSPITDWKIVELTVAQSLGLPEAKGRPVMDQLKEHLAGRHALLYIDNFEQVLPAAPMVSALLAAAPQLKVLVTSRAVLNLRGEYEYVVPPLKLPAPDNADLAQLDAYGAIKLFVERAQAANASFELGPDNVHAVVEICNRLDGVPLAIELAAARVRILPPQSLLDRLSKSLDALGTGTRDLPERQQTLRRTIDWSFELLDEDEKRFFARLAVFVRGQTLDAVEAVCNLEGDIDVFGLICSLVEKSLLVQQMMPSGEARFYQLGTVRQYALELLIESGERDELRRRHGEYYKDLALQAEKELRGPNQVIWVEALEAEYDNLRAALAWAEDQDDPELLLQLTASAWAFWQVRGHLSETARWASKALGKGQTSESRARAEVLRAAGRVAHSRGDLERGKALYEEALEVWAKIGDDSGVGMSLKDLGNLAIEHDEYENARTLYEQSLALHRRAGNRVEEAATLNNLGVVGRLQENWDAAVDELTQSLELFRQIGDQQGTARCLLNLGGAYLGSGDAHKAGVLSRESLVLWRELGGKWDIVDCFEDMGSIAARTDRPADAARLYGAGDALREIVGATPSPFEQALMDQHLDRAKEALGEDGFRKAWDEGRSMSFDDAVDYALEVFPDS
ncbi:MAG TPA: tetratricopeptide repeat protein [Actinomycetota bacterium]